MPQLAARHPRCYERGCASAAERAAGRQHRRPASPVLQELLIGRPGRSHLIAGWQPADLPTLLPGCWWLSLAGLRWRERRGRRQWRRASLPPRPRPWRLQMLPSTRLAPSPPGLACRAKTACRARAQGAAGHSPNPSCGCSTWGKEGQLLPSVLPSRKECRDRDLQPKEEEARPTEGGGPEGQKQSPLACQVASPCPCSPPRPRCRHLMCKTPLLGAPDCPCVVQGRAWPWLPFYADTSCLWAACRAATGLVELQTAHERRGRMLGTLCRREIEPTAGGSKAEAFRESGMSRNVVGLNAGVHFNGGTARGAVVEARPAAQGLSMLLPLAHWPFPLCRTVNT